MEEILPLKNESDIESLNADDKFDMVTPSPYSEQRWLVLAIQLALCLVVANKYLFPRQLRNTHSKILAFMFVLSSMHLYKQKN